MATPYDVIGNNYNDTRQADPFLTQKLVELLNPQHDLCYLDIGCGTGNYTIKLSEQRGIFYGVEPSLLMLREAKRKSKAITWLQGSAESIPHNDNFFSGCIATLTIHHWHDLEKSFSELRRVLKTTKSPGDLYFHATADACLLA